MRLQVFLSRNGVCSRRKAMGLVQDGNIVVNGRIVVEPSFDVDPDMDKISFDGKVVKPKAYKYIMLNKPAGYVTTKLDKFADKTVYDILPEKLRHLSPVGRLDKDTEGLLLLTNDGDFAYQLSHPKFNIDKTYFVIVSGSITRESVLMLEKGVFLDGKKTAPSKIISVKIRKSNSEFLLMIHEGRKRQIRRMLAKTGHKVLYLQRKQQGKYKLGKLALGEYKSIAT